MSDITTPFDAAVEMQRESIRQSRDVIRQGLELQQNALEAFMYNGISAQRSAQRQGVDLLQGLFNAQLDAVESALDDEEFRDAFNSQFDDFEATQRRAWDEFESEFGETFEELSERQQELVAETVDAALTAQREAKEETVESVRAADTVTENATDEAAAVAETTQEQLAQDVRATRNGTQYDDGGDHGERLETIDGLGEAYADRLRGSGIQSLEHLARADTATVAEAAEVSEDHAGEWVSSAQAQA